MLLGTRHGRKSSRKGEKFVARAGSHSSGLARFSTNAVFTFRELQMPEEPPLLRPLLGPGQQGFGCCCWAPRARLPKFGGDSSSVSGGGQVLLRTLTVGSSRSSGFVGGVHHYRDGTPIASPDTTNSTRRFSWRPTATSFDATGDALPKPLAVTEAVDTPCCTI